MAPRLHSLHEVLSAPSLCPLPTPFLPSWGLTQASQGLSCWVRTRQGRGMTPDTAVLQESSMAP